MVILAMPFFIGMIGQTRPILMKCLSLTYYQSQQLQDINRKPPRPPIAPYCHVMPLDRQTYHQHHRQAHSANGERIADFSEQYEHGKNEHHRQQQASDNKALAKSEQQNEHLTAYGSLQKRSS